MDSAQICAAFEAAWTSNPQLHESLAQVTQNPEPSPTAPGMQSVAGHFEFRDGARFKLRYSYEPKATPDAADNNSGSFLSVEDDVGLHFGFLDDINAFLLDVDFASSTPEAVITKALVKAVKMHTRAAATSSKATDNAGASRMGNGNGTAHENGITCNTKPSGRSAAYRIEDHPLAAILAAQQPNARYQRQRPQPFAPPQNANNPNPNANQQVNPDVILPPVDPTHRVIFPGRPGHRIPDGDGRDVPIPYSLFPPAAGAVEANAGNVGAAGDTTGNPAVAEAAGAAGAAAGENAGASSGDRKRGGPAQMDFGSSRLATQALMQQLRILEKQDTRADGFTAMPANEDLYTWDIKLFFEDTSTQLARDLNNLSETDHLKLEFKFPSSFPHEPPVVRFVSPVIVGGHVTLHGAICMELLTAAGWSPVNSVDAVCIQIRALLLAGNAKIDMQRPFATERYTLHGALLDLSSIIHSHGWTVDNGRVAKVKRARNESVGPGR